MLGRERLAGAACGPSCIVANLAFELTATASLESWLATILEADSWDQKQDVSLIIECLPGVTILEDHGVSVSPRVDDQQRNSRCLQVRYCRTRW